MNSPNNPPEIWQVEVNGEIYEANFEELTQWIAEGALLKQDKIRRGNLRWLEAGKIPALTEFFNAKELGIAPPVVTTIDKAKTAEDASPQAENTAVSHTGVENFPSQNFSENQTQAFPNPPEEKTQSFQTFAEITQHTHKSSLNACSLHPAEEAKFICGECANLFCKACPKSYGGSVKICPTCGAICKPITEFRVNQQRTVQYHSDLSKGFGFSDFGNALAYPFKFKTSLFFGAILFMFFSLGQSAAGIGGLFMVASAIIATMMANALTFGVLANTVENMAQGHLSKNFMPDFEDFSLWDDVVHPFFFEHRGLYCFVRIVDCAGSRNVLVHD
jgi:hypothetical protein